MDAKEIRAILLGLWDPLSIGDNPHLSDEYDAYIPMNRPGISGEFGV
jgi:hypothetical protein